MTAVEPGPAVCVTEALRRVMRDLPGIGKDNTASAQQGGYAYRGIEQITKEAQRLFAEHGVVFVPRVIAHDTRDLIVNSKPWTDTILMVEYDVFGPGGREDRITVGPLVGIGRDNSDKGANKALTQTFKYALLQSLCISDAKDDADGTTHEADERQAPQEPAVAALRARDEVAVRIKALGPDAKAAVRQFCVDDAIPTVPADWTDRQLNAVIEQVAHWEAATSPDPAPAAPGGPAAVSGAPEGTGGPQGATQAEPEEDVTCSTDGCEGLAVIFDPAGDPWCEQHQPL